MTDLTNWSYSSQLIKNVDDPFFIPPVNTYGVGVYILGIKSRFKACKSKQIIGLALVWREPPHLIILYE